MPKLGLVPMPISPASSRNVVMWLRMSLGSVVQPWPSTPTYCRSSVQTGQEGGGASAGSNCVPHVVQMNASTARDSSSGRGEGGGVAQMRQAHDGEISPGHRGCQPGNVLDAALCGIAPAALACVTPTQAETCL